MQVKWFSKRVALPTRSKEERGASLVLITLSMVAFLSLAAITVDYAIVSDGKRQLQNGADEAALALARACGEGADACTTAAKRVAEADWYVKKNSSSGSVNTAGIDMSTPNSVTVTARGTQNAGLAKTAGMSSGNVAISAKATAEWTSGGSIVSAEVKLPVMAGYCDFKDHLPKANGDPGDPVQFVWSGPGISTITAPPGKRFVENYCTGLEPNTSQEWGNTPGRALYAKPAALDWFGTESNCRLDPNVGGFFDGAAMESALNLGRFSNAFQPGCAARAATLEIGEVIPMPLYATRVRNYGIWPNASVRVPGRPGNGWDLLSVANAMGTTQIIGFAPFKIEKFYQENTVGGSQGWVNDCTFRTTFNWGITLSAVNPSCSGFRGRFVKATNAIPGAEYGSSPFGPMGPSAPVQVKLTK